MKQGRKRYDWRHRAMRGTSTRTNMILLWPCCESPTLDLSCSLLACECVCVCVCFRPVSPAASQPGFPPPAEAELATIDHQTQDTPEHPDAQPHAFRWASGRPGVLRCYWMYQGATWRWCAGSGNNRVLHENRTSPARALEEWIGHFSHKLHPESVVDLRSVSTFVRLGPLPPVCKACLGPSLSHCGHSTGLP